MGLHDIVHFLQDIGAAVLYDCWSVAIKKRYRIERNLVKENNENVGGVSYFYCDNLVYIAVKFFVEHHVFIGSVESVPA